MPYQWTEIPEGVRLEAWPYRSLPKKGFVILIATMVAFLALPLFALLGSLLLWGMLPFLAATVWGLWAALSRSYRSGEVLETLTLSPGILRLTHQAPGHAALVWEANPYWVRLTLHPAGGPVSDYLTLSGGPREVELGRFLTAEERRRLHGELHTHIAQMRRA